MVIGQPWGGLGDNLQFSTIPRENNHVLVSEQNVYRNLETKDFVWGKNPYIKFTPKGYSVPQYRVIPGLSFIETWEVLFGLEPKNKVPKVYYEPKLLSELQDTILVDLSGISSAAAYQNKKAQFNIGLWMADNLFGRDIQKNVRQVEFAKDIKTNSIALGLNKQIVNSLEDYADKIFSCKEFICSHSGASVLASAIRKEGTTCLVPQDVLSFNREMNLYIFPNIEYISI